MRPVRRGIIISNCQVQPLKHILSLFCRDVSFDGFGVHLLSPHKRAEDLPRFVEDARDKYEIVLTISLSDDFGPLSAARIKETFSGRFVATIPNFYFKGLHPDLTYIGDLGRRVTGPLSEYHSQLAVFGYTTGLSVDETLALFTDHVYDRLGYYDEYEQSLAELRLRDASLDVPFTDELANLLKDDLCFFSVNHPTNFLLAPFCAKLSGWLASHNLAEHVPWPYSPAGLLNHLAQNAVFPIYPEIATACALPFPGSYIFKPPTVGDTPVNCMNLREFIEAEFESFRAFEPDAFLRSPRTRGFIKHAMAALQKPHH